MAASIVIATRESRLALWQAEHVRDLLAQEGDLVALGVDGADQQDDGFAGHSVAPTAENEASRMSTSWSTSSRVMTSGGDRIMLPPEMRTIAPRR